MNKKTSKLEGIKDLCKLIGIVLAVYLVFKILRPNNFGSLKSLFSYFQQSLMPAVAGCGLYFVVVMGLFDFSIGANLVLSAIIGCIAANRFGIVGLAPTIIVATLLGLLNGIIYTKFRIPSIIVTIGMMIVYECLANIAAGGEVLLLNSNLNMFGRAPMNLVLSFCAFFLASYIIKYTKIGVYTNAIGSNEVAARNYGIKVSKYKIIAFTLAGFFAGLMSILTLSYGGAIAPDSNMSSMSRSFTPLMGCFFALAFKSKVNPVISIVLGELIITMIMNGLIAVGFPSTMQNVVIGITLIAIIICTTKVNKTTVVK